jgi:hypothetical protein
VIDFTLSFFLKWLSTIAVMAEKLGEGTPEESCCTPSFISILQSASLISQNWVQDLKWFLDTGAIAGTDIGAICTQWVERTGHLESDAITDAQRDHLSLKRDLATGTGSNSYSKLS